MDKLHQDTPMLSKYLEFQPGTVQYNNKHSPHSASTTRTFPATPRLDNVQVDVWEHFGDNVQKFMTEKLSSLTTEPHESFEFASISRKVAIMDMTFNIVNEVQSLFNEFYLHLVERANFLIFGHIVKLSPCKQACLHPDLEIMLYKGHERLTLAVAQVESPKTLPCDEDLVTLFKEEQMRLEPNPTTFEFLRQDDKVIKTQSKETRVSRAITQLWGYMTVNHLKYGLLTTFNNTFFFKRLSIGKLEISRGIAVDDSKVPLVGALCYFTSLLLDSHLFTAQDFTPTLTRRHPVLTSKYDVANVTIADFHFALPADFKAGHVVLGQYAEHKPTLLKILDSTQIGRTAMFHTELTAYQRLEELQGICVPTFEQAYLMSNFLFCLALEDCGKPITATQLHTHYDLVVQALKMVHGKGVAHGDIALRNILLDATETQVVLIDFGLARLYDNGAQPSGIPLVSSKVEWEQICSNDLLRLEELL
jgi:hypothetical protein